MIAKGLRPFLIYPAILKVKVSSETHQFKSAKDAENFFATLEGSQLSVISRSNNRFEGLSASPLLAIERDPMDTHGPAK